MVRSILGQYFQLSAEQVLDCSGRNEILICLGRLPVTVLLLRRNMLQGTAAVWSADVGAVCLGGWGMGHSGEGPRA